MMRNGSKNSEPVDVMPLLASILPLLAKMPVSLESNTHGSSASAPPVIVRPQVTLKPPTSVTSWHWLCREVWVAGWRTTAVLSATILIGIWLLKH
jgi:hypothetical protein